MVSFHCRGHCGHSPHWQVAHWRANVAMAPDQGAESGDVSPVACAPIAPTALCNAARVAVGSVKVAIHADQDFVSVEVRPLLCAPWLLTTLRDWPNVTVRGATWVSRV